MAKIMKPIKVTPESDLIRLLDEADSSSPVLAWELSVHALRYRHSALVLEHHSGRRRQHHHLGRGGVIRRLRAGSASLARSRIRPNCHPLRVPDADRDVVHPAVPDIHQPQADQYARRPHAGLSDIRPAVRLIGFVTLRLFFGPTRSRATVAFEPLHLRFPLRRILHIHETANHGMPPMSSTEKPQRNAHVCRTNPGPVRTTFVPIQPNATQTVA